MSNKLTCNKTLADTVSKTDLYDLVNTATPTAALITDLDAKATPAAGDYLMLYDAAAATLKKANVNTLPVDGSVTPAKLSAAGSYTAAGFWASGTVGSTTSVYSSGTIGSAGAAAFGSTLAVTGAANITGTLHALTNFTSEGAVLCKYTLQVLNNATTLGGTLGVTGAATFSSTLGVTGVATFNGSVVLAASAPASSSDTGTLGEIRVSGDYIYVCTSTNIWKRAQLVAF